MFFTSNLYAYILKLVPCIFIIGTVNQQMHKSIALLYITRPLHVSTLLCQLQGARSQHLLSYISMSMLSWWYILKIYICFVVNIENHYKC
jgi:hypothetical protein